MKNKILSLWLLPLALLTFAGCGGSAGVDEKKPLEQIITEAKTLTETQLKAMIEKYQAAIEAKKPEIEKIQEKLKAIPVTQLLGEDAKALKDDIAKLNESIKSLTERLNVYANQLKTMAQ